jgi:hypothetical protein
MTQHIPREVDVLFHFVYRPNGGAVTVLAGDFRQTLPDIPQSTLYFTFKNYNFFI